VIQVPVLRTLLSYKSVVLFYVSDCFKRVPVVSLIKRFKIQTQLVWKLLLSIDMKTVFLLLIFSGDGLPVLKVRVFYQSTQAIPTHVRLNFVTKQYTHCTETHVRCNVCHLATWL